MDALFKDNVDIDPSDEIVRILMPYVTFINYFTKKMYRMFKLII